MGKLEPKKRLTKSLKQNRGEALEALARMEMTAYADSKIGELSGGQRQSLTLLMTTLMMPELLLLDEHTAALDPKTAAKVLELTDTVVRENKLTTLMITHNMQQAIQYGNRMIMLHQGKIQLDIKGEEKAKLTVNDVVAKFGHSLKDEALLAV